ncbi:nucleotidyl transferase AbiEii/AbiGii toxin family protein [Streptomyces sp. NPDC002643]
MTRAAVGDFGGGATEGARRAALDHVLGLIAGAPWSETLVLRGSMVMPAWAGSRARDPADLDFVVVPELNTPVDPLQPYPYVDRVDLVQHWPEALDGAARYEIWSDAEEECETRGLRPRTPPDGLRWDSEPDPADSMPSYDELLELVRRRPEVAPGVVLDPDAARQDRGWGYSYGGDETGGDGAGGVRMLIPWRVEGGPGGEVQLDFALDERLPHPPVWNLVPRADGGAPSVVRTASRELSLAWKLLWLYADAASDDGPRCKDLYDAVLLAEDSRTRLSPRLLRKVVRGSLSGTAPDGFSLDAVRCDEADWTAFRADHHTVRGTAKDWLQRLTTALAPAVTRGW